MPAFRAARRPSGTRLALMTLAMRKREPHDRRCSYVVFLESESAARDQEELAAYLSTLGVAGCEVIVVDPSPPFRFELNARVLRWVGRHVAFAAGHCGADGRLDYVHAADLLASCEKVIVATDEVRYEPESIAAMCETLDSHDAVEPEDFFEIGPWWSGVEAGRLLAQRAIEPGSSHCVTFGFRKSALASLRPLAAILPPPQHRLALAGADVCTKSGVYVKRVSGGFTDWLARRTRIAALAFASPVRSALFFAVLPLLVALVILGGLRLAGMFALLLAVFATAAAIRGRSGASGVFPLRACLFAPLALLESSVSIYLALFLKMRGAEIGSSGVAVPERSGGQRVASGE